MRFISWTIALWLSLAGWSSVFAENTIFNPELKSVFQNLAVSSSPEQYRQIVSAVEQSNLLIEQMNRMAASGKLRSIKVVEKGELKGKGNFIKGYIEDAAIIFSRDLLNALRNDRLFDVVYPDDIPPNNTTFALAHLSYHLETEESMMNALTSMPRETYVNTKLEDEATAFIYSWNAMLDGAIQRSGLKSLSSRQETQLLMNCRYRFVYLKALKQTNEPLQFSPSGVIEINKRNIKAIKIALEDSQMADIE